MLGKLLKYDFKSMGRFLWPIMGAMVVLAAVVGLCIRLQEAGYMAAETSVGQVISVITGIFIALGVMAMFAAGVIAMVLIIKRFYSNVLSDEGYLTMTLPISTDELIISKVLSGTIFSFIVAIVTSISMMILTSLTVNGPTLGEIFDGLSNAIAVTHQSGVYFTVPVILGILSVIVSCFAGLLQIYLSLTIGSVLVQKHKVLVGVAVFMAINMIVSIISSILFVVIGNDIIPFGGMSVQGVINLCFAAALVFTAIIAAVFYILLKYILNKKLNLV